MEAEGRNEPERFVCAWWLISHLNADATPHYIKIRARYSRKMGVDIQQIPYIDCTFLATEFVSDFP
jgi:hypothetical protein